MKAKPKENRILIQGKATITLNPKQRWDKKDCKFPGIVIVEKQNIKLSLSNEEYDSYFVEVSV